VVAHRLRPRDGRRDPHVVGLVADGTLEPVVHEIFPLADAADAHRVLEERRQYGKLILAP
jgi:NADPH:quinone reductase-like Zn-dependent oxidoreductase